jgi:hypothetical protein
VSGAVKQVLVNDVWVLRDGAHTLLPAGSSVPGWAKDLVTNPKAFVDAVPAPAEGESGNDSGKPGEYSTWKNGDLKAALKERDLPVGGNHDELVARLIEWDAEKAKEAAAAVGESGDDSDLGDPGDDENKE